MFAYVSKYSYICILINIKWQQEENLELLYMKENVQLVLSYINIMKNQYSEKDFIEMCRLVYLNSI